MKLESLVILNQNVRVNTFPGVVLYTPPVTPWESVIPEVGSLTIRRGPAKVGQVTGVKS